MPNYSKGKIYSIRFHNDPKLIYIGSTIDLLSKRFHSHKRNKDCSYYQYIQEHYDSDFSNSYIELIENYECKDKAELNKKEGEFIRQYKEDENYQVINKNIAGRTMKEYCNDNKDNIKEQKKEYYENNKDKLKEKNKEWRENNKDKIKEKNKEYQKENQEEIKEYKKKYKKENKDKINEKFNCLCGGCYIFNNKAQHNKSKRHQEFILK